MSAGTDRPNAGLGAGGAVDPLGTTLLYAPPLALVATVAAVFDLLINRVAVRAMAELVEPTTVLWCMRVGVLPRNLSGVAGICALLAGLFGYLKMAGFAPLYVRLPVAAFAGLLMPALTLATVLPRERMAPQLVLFGVFATYVLVCLFAAVCIGYRNRWLRAGLALALATALQALTVVTIAGVRAIGFGGFGGPVAYVARHGGEVAWLLFPFAVAPAVFPPSWTWRWRVAAALGTVALALVLAAGIAGEQVLHPHYSTVLYGAFRVAMLPERASIAYVVPPGIALAAGLMGMLGPDPWRRQVGAALLLWICGGYAPRSPIQLLDTVLSVVLLARAAQAADPEGIRRAKLRWTFGRALRYGAPNACGDAPGARAAGDEPAAGAAETTEPAAPRLLASAEATEADEPARPAALQQSDGAR